MEAVDVAGEDLVVPLGGPLVQRDRHHRDAARHEDDDEQPPATTRPGTAAGGRVDVVSLGHARVLWLPASDGRPARRRTMLAPRPAWYSAPRFGSGADTPAVGDQAVPAGRDRSRRS